MKRIKNALKLASLLFLCSLLACVTINIYFPAEKVESVAQDIVDDIRGREAPGGAALETGRQESLIRKIRVSLSPATAWAQDVTEVSNATIRALKERMKGRYQQMKPFYDDGFLREGDDGFVSTGNIESLGLREKRDLNSLVDAENQDRRTLYQEVARALNIDPGQIDRIGQIFAKEWKK